MYVTDQYKTPEMWDKVILGNARMLRFIPDCYKNKKVCFKAVDKSSYAL